MISEVQCLRMPPIRNQQQPSRQPIHRATLPSRSLPLVSSGGDRKLLRSRLPTHHGSDTQVVVTGAMFPLATFLFARALMAAGPRMIAVVPKDPCGFMPPGS